MKVLYIVNDTLLTGGSTKSLLVMLREAERHGVEYQVVCPDNKGLVPYLVEKGVKVHVVDYRFAMLPFDRTVLDKMKWVPRLMHNHWLNIRAISFVEKVAREFKPDIIHENASVLNVGYQVAKRLNIPDVIHVREYGDLDFKLKLPGIKKRLHSPATHKISITKDIARYRDLLGDDNSTVIYNGLIKSDKVRFNSKKKSYFLYAGRIEDAKGISELIEAYGKYVVMTDNVIPLFIAGRCNFPDYLADLKKIVASSGLESHIEWLGERMDVADLMYDATATLIPSRFEAFGRVMPEAMANGSLCVGRNTGGTKEQMNNGLELTGEEIALRYDTVEQLAQILYEISHKVNEGNPFDAGGEYFNMIARSQKAIVSLYSEESFGENLIRFYDKVVSK